MLTILNLMLNTQGGKQKPWLLPWEIHGSMGHRFCYRNGSQNVLLLNFPPFMWSYSSKSVRIKFPTRRVENANNILTPISKMYTSIFVETFRSLLQVISNPGTFSKLLKIFSHDLVPYR